MRLISRFFVCFFLLFSLMAARPFPSFLARLETLEQMAEDCTFHNAKQLSKSLSQLGQDLHQAMEPLQEKVDRYDQKIEKLNDQSIQAKKEYQRMQGRMALYLLQEQRSYPYASFGALENQGSALEACLQKRLDTLQQEETLKQTKQKLLLDLDILKEYDKRVQKVQTSLFTRFQKTDGFQPGQDGNANKQQMIQGTQNLPVFGSVHGGLQDRHFSCLLEESTITATSSFWGKVADTVSISAGTWSYPHGGLHLGMDLALPLYSPVYAPANGIVLYADAPCASDGGYLGNMEGWPYGGGNTLCIIVSVHEKLYALSFAHLSTRLQVSAGQQFTQGDVLAYSGNSGNSSGPHTHIEVFELHVSLKEAIQYFIQDADFSFGCGWQIPQSQSIWATRQRPEETIV